MSHPRSKAIGPLLAAGVMVTSAGVLLASNMAFKYNRSLCNTFLLSQAPKNENWVSVPYNSYPNAKALCNALGATTILTTLYQHNPITGAALLNYPCSQATFAALDTSRGVRVRIAGTTISNAILAGSHDETRTLPPVLGSFVLLQTPRRDNYISVPYHTFWVKAEDICVSLGLHGSEGSVTKFQECAGTRTEHPCGTTLIKNFDLVIGEAVLIRKTSVSGGNCDVNGDDTANSDDDICSFLPPHL